MVREAVARGGRVKAPCHRGERRFGTAQNISRCGLRRTSKQPVGERGYIHICDNGIGNYLLAVGKFNAARFAVMRKDFADRRVILKHGAAGLRECGDHLRQPMHPALDSPNTTLLRMRDQHERRRRGKR